MNTSWWPYVALLLTLAACRNPSTELLDNPVARERFARSATLSLTGDNPAWLRERLIPPSGRGGGDLQPGDLATGWLEEWADAHTAYGQVSLVREEAGPVDYRLWFSNFDGEKPVYLCLTLGQAPMPKGPRGHDSLVVLDWAEYPGALSARGRWRSLEQLRSVLGPEALSTTVIALVEASRAQEAGDPITALQILEDLPEAAQAQALVVAERLRMLAETGSDAFTDDLLSAGGILEAPAVAYLAFCWSLAARDADGLRRSTADLARQFGPDSVLAFYAGLAAEWSGDCPAAQTHYDVVRTALPNHPLVSWAGLNCDAATDPDFALDRLLSLLVGSELSLDEFDVWMAEAVPVLHRSRVYHDWRLSAPERL